MPGSDPSATAIRRSLELGDLSRLRGVSDDVVRSDTVRTARRIFMFGETLADGL